MKMLEWSMVGDFFGHVWSESVPLFVTGYSLGLGGGRFWFAVPNIDFDASTSAYEDLASKSRQISYASTWIPRN